MYKAIKDRIIIKADELNDNSLIWLKQQPCISGVVVDVGAEVQDIKVNDHIIFHHYDDLAIPETQLRVVREKSVLGIIQNEVLKINH